MIEKSEFSKTKGSIFNMPIEVENIYDILRRPTVSNRLIVVKLKRVQIYFKPVCRRIIYKHLLFSNIIVTYMEILLQMVSQVSKMLGISDIVQIQWENENVTENIIYDGREMSESMNDTETKYPSVEDPLSMYRTASNKKTLISEISNIINEENVVITPG